MAALTVPPQEIATFTESFNELHYWHWLSSGEAVFVRDYGYDAGPGGYQVLRLSITVFAAAGELLAVRSRTVIETDLPTFNPSDSRTWPFYWNVVGMGDKLLLLNGLYDFATKTQPAYIVDLAHDAMSLTPLTFTTPEDFNQGWLLGERDDSSCYATYGAATQGPPFFYTYDGRATILTLVGNTLTMGPVLSMGATFYPAFGVWVGGEALIQGATDDTYSQNAFQFIKESNGELVLNGPLLPVSDDWSYDFFGIGEHRWAVMFPVEQPVQPFNDNTMYDYVMVIIDTSSGTPVVGDTGVLFSDTTDLVFVDGFGNEWAGYWYWPGAVVGDGANTVYMFSSVTKPVDTNFNHNLTQGYLRTIDISGTPEVISSTLFPATPLQAWQPVIASKGANGHLGGSMAMSFESHFTSDAYPKTRTVYAFVGAAVLTGGGSDVRVHFRAK